MRVKVSTGFIALIACTVGAADWAQWGGPNRDFQADASERLADSWPASGPRKLWERQLGEGYSAIAVRGDSLYTMYRREAAFWQIFTADQEVVAALERRTGATKWEFAYDATFKNPQGPGPHAMPQLAGDLLFSVGSSGKVHALKAQTGELVWKRDLYEELGGSRLSFGYASHPLFYGGNLIVTVGGGKNKGVAAIDQKSGRIVWARFSFANAYSSPILIRAGDLDQVVILAAQQILAVDPHDGKALWTLSLGTDAAMAFCSTPLWDAATQTLVFAGAYSYGATALRISADGARTLWQDRKLQLLFGNMLLAGGTIYFSRGYYGPSFLTAVDIKTGESKWSAREFARASLLGADGKLIILDEEGWLGLARLNPDRSLKILSKARVLSENAWTVPTLVDGRLYLRDRKVIMALDAGTSGGVSQRER